MEGVEGESGGKEWSPKYARMLQCMYLHKPFKSIKEDLVFSYSMLLELHSSCSTPVKQTNKRSRNTCNVIHVLHYMYYTA